MLILSRRSVRCWISLALVLALLLPASSARPVSASPGGTRLVVLSKLDGPALPSGLTVVQDYGSFVLARVSDAQLAALPEANIADRLDDRTLISLNGRVWDTAKGEPAIPADLRSAVSDPYFLVQFQGPIASEWRESLLALGAVILGYHPNYTYLVRMAPPLLPRAQALPGVQWVGRYHPAYRLASDDEFAIAPVDNGRLAVEVITVLIPLALFGVLGLAAVVLVHELAEVVVIANGVRAGRTRGLAPSAAVTPSPAHALIAGT